MCRRLDVYNVFCVPSPHLYNNLNTSDTAEYYKGLYNTVGMSFLPIFRNKQYLPDKKKQIKYLYETRKF